jgi:hypothetical protein
LAGKNFPPNFHLYPMDRAALGYELTTLKPGSSMIWALTLIVTLSRAWHYTKVCYRVLNWECYGVPLKVHFATVHPPTTVTAGTKYIHASNMMRRA